MQAIQIIAIIFAVFAFSRVFLRFRDKRLTPKEHVMWTIIWVALIALAIFPQVIGFISEAFGINRPVDIVIYGSIIIMFYLLFRLYVQVESLKSDVTKIVREVTIKRAEDKNKKKK